MVARNYIVRKLLVDQGSSVDIFYTSTLQKMQILKSSLTPYHGDLVRFSGKRVNVLGVVELRTTLGTESNIKTIGVRYLVIDSRAPYHMILGRPSLNTLGVVVSTLHLTLKFLISPTEVGVVHAYWKEAR